MVVCVTPLLPSEFIFSLKECSLSLYSRLVDECVQPYFIDLLYALCRPSCSSFLFINMYAFCRSSCSPFLFINLLYSLSLQAKLFLIPVRSSYICGVVVLVGVTLMLLFQMGVLHVWLWTSCTSGHVFSAHISLGHAANKIALENTLNHDSAGEHTLPQN